MQQPLLEAVVERLERVERENRRWQVAGLLAVVALASVLVMGQSSPPTRLTVESLRVSRPGSNEPAIMMFTDSNGNPQVSLHDPNGESRVLLRVYEEGSAAVYVRGSTGNGTGVASATMVYDPGPGSARFYVMDKDQRQVWWAP
jgi:hypothetical protein